MAQSDIAESVRIIACGALAHEITAIIALNDLANLDIKCLPAIWHNHPEKIAPGVKAEISAARAAGINNIFVAYADCGTGGQLKAVCKEEGVDLIPGPHCYSFFTGNDLFAKQAEDDLTSFYLTDFLARQFDTFIIKGYKLDKRPELKELLFAHYTKLIYLAQTHDDKLKAKAQNAAEFLELEYEFRFTGYGDLTDILSGASSKTV